MSKSACQNPKLIISHHYDSIVREIDIIFEEMIQGQVEDETKVMDLNRDRDEIMVEVRQAERETFEFYETSLKAELKHDKTIKNLELKGNKKALLSYLESKLFANKSIGLFRRSNTLCVIIFDFYVDQARIICLQ